jgi:lipoprotein-anchoring transpeptidase ErfK/SrfK
MAVVAAIVSMVAFVSVSLPRSLNSSGDRTVLVGVPRTVPFSVGELRVPETTTTTVAAPAPEPTTVEVSRGRGRTLRVGVAPRASIPATIADAIGSEVPLFSAPGQAEPDDWLDNPTWEGLPVLFLVHGRQGDWLNVQVSMRPNQATAWVRASDVTTRETSYHVLIDTGARTLTAYNGSSVVLSASVAPGTSSTPTPTGEFFVDGIVRPPDPYGVYGAYQISVAAFSNVHYSFGGGIGQIAVHGTNRPELIGTPASNGCVRMTNEDVTALATLVPLGTPVRIV